MRLRSSSLLILLSMGAAARLGHAQTPPSPTPTPSASATAEVPAFNMARTPASPAFTVLGIAPTQVERPTTPAGLAISVLNQTEGLSALPKDAAMELSPYWLLGHPHLTWRQDEVRSVGDSIARTATFSVATAQTGEQDSPVTSLGFGARTSILSGRLTDAARNELMALEATLTRQSAAFSALMETHGLALAREQLRQRLLLGQITPQQFQEEFEVAKRAAAEAVMASDEYKKIEAATTKQAARLSGARSGFVLDAAGGIAWDFPGAAWDAHRLRQWGLWLTPSYVTDSVSLVGVVRYLREGEAAHRQRTLDLGARVIHSRDRYALSAEYLYERRNEGGPSAGRYAGLIEYAVLPDTWATLSVGRGLTPAGAKTVIAQVALSFNFSEKRYEFPR